MNIEVSRRHFMKLAGAGVAGSAIAALGFGEAEAQVAAHVRPFKLASATETRNTCPYCSVACGVIMYSRGDIKKGEKAEIFHIEGDSDHPTNRGTLCPKGAALLDFVKSETRTKVPRVREAGSKQWKEVSWDDALNRDRPPHEGRPRCELRRRPTRTARRSIAGSPPASWPRQPPPTKRRSRPTRRSAAPACSCSTTRRVSDTARRCPVWARRLAVVR